MRLALLIDDYMPDSTRVGAKMFHELACEFVKCGHEVVVITPGINQKNPLEKSDLDGVAVWKFNSGPIKDIGKIKRAINETMLSTRAWNAIKSELNSSFFDGIVYYSPSIFFSRLVTKLKKTCGCASYLVLRDLFPQWAVDEGLMKEGSLIEKYFRFFEKLNYKAANHIGLMSQNNLTLFNNRTDNLYQTNILRNWAAFSPFNFQDADFSYREKLNINNKTIYFYGGNIGHAQDMENLMRLARDMQSYAQAHFLFVGQGDEVELINKLAADWKLDNFTYLPSVNQEEFKHLLSEVDVGLFSLAHSHTAHNFPGKLLGYMVESLPILGSVNPGNDLLDIVREYDAGDIFINGDDKNLFEAAITYLDDEYRNNKGNNATALLHKEFTVESAAKDIVNIFSHR
ncbi:glycosyl transferase, group 1 [Psychromonas ingrahamii 37]|uniref:Glycosyl transferase, group 1 n=1 Tax=Psychromonas ingrahamii (strain DSM 17664 / CCUG 51855 / 37) TaxID=357804 RepID=A1ST21_PSYIN|nr:glycosyltransferase family 4 protein [Psychromonas ingrahamii]ABM02636.1 glycosyl transferase, group 1 [Psychromonas ingrahamii 37]